MTLLADLDAARLLAAGEASRRKKPRVVRGDGLGVGLRQQFAQLEDKAMVSFKSILQGDHLGVEIATQSHANLLRDWSLLHDNVRMVSNKPLPSLTEVQGLCIDDFFAISLEDRGTEADDTKSLASLRTALQAYDRNALEGSPHKDVFAADDAKVVGARLNTSARAAKLGVATVSAPSEKRYGLSVLSLCVAQLSHVSDALHVSLLGGWTSVLVFRRNLMGILQESYKLVRSDSMDPSSPVLVPLTRKVAEELTLLAVLAPLATSELNAEYMDEVFCSDASMSHGAVCHTMVSKEVSQLLWRSCRTKGAFTRLQTPTEAMLDRMGLRESLTEDADWDDFTTLPERPFALRFDFVEVFAGSGRVSVAMQRRGFSVCCPIDISRSSELNLAWAHVASWLAFMISEKRVKSFICEPPCTTFSLMRRPALRSKEFPYGFNPLDAQTSDGNMLAHRSFQLLFVGMCEDVTGLIETVFAGKMRYLPAWKHLENHPKFSWCRTDSCAYGSPHLKSFRFMGVNADLRPLHGRCSKDHEHVRVEGKFTMGPAIYTEALADALAEVMARGVARLETEARALDSVKVDGLESQLVNEVAVASTWKTLKVWEHKKVDHINLFELESVYKLACELAMRRKSLRPVCLVDSVVTRCAASKGRSSSLRLSTVLRKLGSICAACGLYFTLPFVPTRLNASDDPTRSVPVRQPCLGLGVEEWEEDQLYRLSQLPRLRRWASNWVRLLLRLLGPEVLLLNDRSLYRVTHYHDAPQVGFSDSSNEVSRLLRGPRMDFDTTLGFPGEGPSAISCLGFYIFLSLHSVSAFGSAGCVVVLVFAPAEAMDDVFRPRNPGDVSRAAARRNRPPLPPGRPVLQVTSDNRAKLLNAFFEWLATLDIDSVELLEEPHKHLQRINDLLNRYGRGLYFGGRPYGHYCETINALASYRPSIKRSLQGAWDLAFGWVRDEKPNHHIAMPWQLLLAMLTVSLSWGWVHFAGGLALCFGSLLRPGEFLNARRCDLMLPSDVGFTQSFALLSILEPKTRFTVARHQCAKLDVPDMLAVASLAFSKQAKDQPLWPMSSQTFRSRFKQVLGALGVAEVIPGMAKTCDPGSLRAGGATWLLQTCEDAEFVRRRGRWISAKVMEVYIQEIGAVQYMMQLSDLQRERVVFLARSFPAILQYAQQCSRLGMPTKTWWRLWMAEVVGKSGT